jgi:ribosomal protein S18 acetylase RimI-like enzyme
VLEKPGSAWTYGYIIWLGVAPNTGRKGIGAKLVKHLQELFIEQGARMVLADTDADNAPAIGFFKNMGFGLDSEHVYLSKNLTYDPDYIEFHRTGRVAERRRRAAQLMARKGNNA